jgi:hypothetical protein
MSNPQSVAAVTKTLLNLLSSAATGGATVTVLPPDKAAEKKARLLNLFLYQATPSAAWRNTDLAGGKPGVPGRPALGLNLYYLLTAFSGDSGDDTDSQVLLGQAMSILHDHPVLGAAEILAASPTTDLHLQVERVRLTLQPLTLDDIFKLWSGYQTPYRLSAAYEASVVLIDSGITPPAPQPVLERRGLEPRAVLPSLPFIDAIEPTLGVGPGDRLTVRGRALQGDVVSVRFTSTLPSDPTVFPWEGTPPAPKLVTPAKGTKPGEWTAPAPDDPLAWPAGLLSVAVVVTRRDPGRPDTTFVSNEVSLPMGPKLTLGPAVGPAVHDPQGHLVLTADAMNRVGLRADFRPSLRFYQRASLLFDDRAIAVGPRGVSSAALSSLTFTIPDVTPDPDRLHLVRLRVDGAVSPVVDTSADPPTFLAASTVKVKAP